MNKILYMLFFVFSFSLMNANVISYDPETGQYTVDQYGAKMATHSKNVNPLKDQMQCKMSSKQMKAHDASKIYELENVKKK